jgi:hypothetical protein
MTARSFNSVIDHTSDAGFRAWGSELSSELTAAGLPLAADTGQINWTTVTRPGINALGGYEIRYLNDSLHATKPCYIRIEYRTAGTATMPLVSVGVASATNGAGTLSGTTYLGQTTCTYNYTIASTVINRLSHVCVAPGFFGMVLKRSGVTDGWDMGHFFLCRTESTDGTPNSQGFHFYYYTPPNTMNRITYIASSINDGTASHGCYPTGGSTTSIGGGDVQAFPTIGLQPQARVIGNVLIYRDDEIGNNSTFVATPVGVAARTFVCIGGPNAPLGIQNSVLRYAMRYSS